MLAGDVLVSKERFCGRIRHLVLTWAADTGGYTTDEPRRQEENGKPGCQELEDREEGGFVSECHHILLSNHLLF